MLLSLGSALLVLVITANLALRRGLYRSTILFFSCLIAAVAAFGYYENVLVLLSLEFLRQFGEGLALLVLFMAVALVLDLLADRFLTGRMRLPALFDQIGGGFVGFWTAMIAVGVLCVALQMLPWDRTVLGFDRIYRDRKGRAQTRHLLLAPDAFTVGLVGYLTDNTFGGAHRFRSVHPDLLEELARSNMRVQAESRRVVPPDIESTTPFRVESLMEIEDPELGYAQPTRDKKGQITIRYQQAAREPAEGHRYLVARCSLRNEAADPDDQWHRFTPQQVRMVGTLNGVPRQYYLRGYREPSKMSKHGLVSSEQPILFNVKGEARLDLIFEVPEDFVPSFVEYKRLARSEVRGDKIPTKPTEEILATLKYIAPVKLGGEGRDLPEALKRLRARPGSRPPRPGAKTPRRGPTRPPARRRPAKPRPKSPARRPAPRPKAAPRKAPARSKPGPTAAKGRVGGRLVQGVSFGPKLPFALSRKGLADQHAELAGSAFRAGHVYVPAANARGDPRQLVTTFAVPPEFRLLRLKCSALHARSLFGKAKAAAVKGVGQFAVVDSARRNYLPVGEIRIATVGGKRMMELQYDADGLPGRSIRPPTNIRENQLQAGTIITLLYHIPPGTRLVEFTAGPHALSKSRLNATAPE